MAEELSSVRAEHKFDETALDEYLKKNLQGFSRGPGTLNVLQYRFVFDLIASMISKTSDLIIVLHTSWSISLTSVYFGEIGAVLKCALY